MARNTPHQHLIDAAHDRPLVLVAGQECRLIGCTPYSGRAKVLRNGRYYIMPAATVHLIDPQPQEPSMPTTTSTAEVAR